MNAEYCPGLQDFGMTSRVSEIMLRELENKTTLGANFTLNAMHQPRRRSLQQHACIPETNTFT